MPDQTLTAFLDEIADAIREVEGSEGEIPAREFAERIRGLSGSGDVDSSELKAAIASARTTRSTAKVEGEGDYDFGTKVAPKEAAQALDEAISQAQATYDIYGTGPINQKQLDEAQRELEAAVKTFNSASKVLAADTTAFEAQKTRLAGLVAAATQSADGKDVTFGSKWYTAADKATADAAVSTAQSAITAATKQSQVDAAVATLKSAIDAFEKAIKTASANTAALDAAISAANAAKTDVQTSDSEGSDLPSGSKYVTNEQMDTFDAAISAATTAKTASTTQAQIDAATATLTAATSTFEGQVKTNFTPPADIKDASWADIAQLANLAAAEPSSYTKYLGQEKTFTYGGFNVTARIVGCSQDDRAAGGKVGFTFEIYKGMGTHRMNASNTTAGGYASTEMKTYLEGLAFPEDLQPLLQEFVVKYRDGSNTGAAAKSLNAKVALMSAINMYWAGCNADAYSMSAYFWPDEGETYQYFKNNDTTQSRIHYNNSGGANFAWLLSPYDTTTFMNALSNGGANYSYASSAYVPAVRFCLGSSI